MSLSEVSFLSPVRIIAAITWNFLHISSCLVGQAPWSNIEILVWKISTYRENARLEVEQLTPMQLTKFFQWTISPYHIAGGSDFCHWRHRWPCRPNRKDSQHQRCLFTPSILQGSGWVYGLQNEVQSHFKALQGSGRISRGLQGCPGVSKSAQGFAWLSWSPQGVCKTVQGSAKLTKAI